MSTGKIFTLQIPNHHSAPVQLADVPKTGTILDYHQWFVDHPLPNRDLVKTPSLVASGKALPHPFQQILEPPKHIDELAKRGQRLLFFMYLAEPVEGSGFTILSDDPNQRIPQISMEVQRVLIQVEPILLEWKRPSPGDASYHETLERLVALLTGQTVPIIAGGKSLSWRAGTGAMACMEMLPHFSPDLVDGKLELVSRTGKVCYPYPSQKHPDYQPTPGDCPEAKVVRDDSLPEWEMQSECGLYNLTISRGITY